jgi:acetolactate synthase-1/2/3 large subunit
MRGADVLVEMLIQHGVKCIFGVPGDTSMAFHDALRLRAAEIRHVLCRDERHAAYAADAYCRVTGRLGVVEVPSGGGALYVVPGLSEANVSNIPLLCIASEISMSSEETYALTDCNQEQLFSAVTRWNTKVKSSQTLPHLLRKAIRLSCAGASGATAISVPENVLRETYTGDEAALYPTAGIEGFTSYRNEPLKSDVESLLVLLQQARRPLVLAGGGVHLSGAYAKLAHFVQRFQLPIITSVDGKGSISEYYEYSLGTVGANGGSNEANEFAKMADLVIVLGCKLDNVTTFGRRLISPDAKVIQVDISEAVLGNNQKVTLPIMTDIKALLKAATTMADNSVDYSEKHKDWLQQAKAKIKEKWDRIAAEGRKESSEIVVAQLIAALDQIADEETIFTGDAGNPTPYIASYIRSKAAGKRTILPRGHGALGYALPAAIGAQLGAPQSRVIALFGDGSFGMAMGELETAKRLGLPIIFINLQNDCYGWIKTIQRLYYKQQYYGVDFSALDGVKIAEGFGIKGRNIHNKAQLNKALSWAWQVKGEPVFLDVMIESIEEFVPPVCQWEKDILLPEDARKKLVY